MIRLPPAMRAVVTIIAGVALVGAFFLPAVFAVAADEGENPTDGLIGAALLLSPYLVLALAGRRARLSAWIVLLILLLVGTSLGLVAAGSSSTGGLIFLWLLPLQLILALLPLMFSQGTAGDRT